MTPRTGTTAFLRFDPPSRGCLLEPGIVEEVGDESWTLCFDTRHDAVETGEERLLYYSRSRHFYKQAVRISSTSADGPPFKLTITPLGAPIETGTRAEARVDIFDCGLVATVDGESDCPIHDVSLSGLSVASRSALPFGRSVEVSIRFEDTDYVGEMEVRGSSPLPDGRTRYGLFGVFDVPEGRALQNGLTRMTLEIQNQRLQERSGTST